MWLLVLFVLHVPLIISTQFFVLNFDALVGILSEKTYLFKYRIFKYSIIFAHHLWGRVVDQEIPRNPMCCSSLCKVVGCQTQLTSMKLDSIREIYLKIWKKASLRKSFI